MTLPTRWVKVLRDIWGHKARSVIVILSIAVGVFAVGMTINARNIIQRDLNEAHRATNPASTTLFCLPFEQELAQAVAALDEVKQAEARRTEIARVERGNDEWMDIEISVVRDYDNLRINQFTVESGQNVPGLGQVLLERASAKLLGVSVGDTITVAWPGDKHSHTLKVAGIVHDLHKMPPQWSDQGAAYVSMDTLQRMGLDAGYNTLDIIVAENPTDKAHILRIVGLVRDRVLEPAGSMVAGVKPSRGEPGTHFASQDVAAMLLVLMAMGGMCLLLGAGLVINTTSALIGQQVRQIGIIRSVGGLRKQVALMYLANVLIFSLCALVIAIPLGLLGARGLAAGVGEQMNFVVTRVELPLSVALLQVAVGLLVPIGAAIVPITSGSGISVYDAIYQHGNITTVNKGVVEGLLKRIKGLSSPAILAARNTFRHRARLVFTLATLTLAGATFMASFTTHLSLKKEIGGIGRYWLFDVALQLPADTDVHAAERTALAVEGVAIAEGWYRTSAQVVFPDQSESERIEVLAVPHDAVTLDPLLIAGRWIEAGDTNAIVVNEDTLDEIPDLQIGSEVVLGVNGADRRTSHRFVVVGIVSRHLYGPRIYAPYEFLTQLKHVPGQVNLVRVRTNPTVLQDGVEQKRLAARLEEQFTEAGIGSEGSETQYEAVVSNLSNFDILLNVLLLMAGLLALVGGLGLGGTMSLNVLERTREIGVLRALGASNAAVRKIVLFEGAVVGLISWILGVLVAFPLGHVFANAVSGAILGTKVALQFSTLGMGLWLALVLAIAALASLAPAQRAVKLTVREVLAYE